MVSMLVLARRMVMRYTRGCVSLVGHRLLAEASTRLDTQWRVFWGMATSPSHHLVDVRRGLAACSFRHVNLAKLVWRDRFWACVGLVPHARACAAQCCAQGVGIRLPFPLLGGAGREVACACCIACARRCGSHKCRTDAILALLVSWIQG